MAAAERRPSAHPAFEIADVDIELPLALTRRHEHFFVGFDFAGELLGWHARLAGDGGDVVVNFPWYTTVDRSLGGGQTHLVRNRYRSFDYKPMPLYRNANLKE